LDVDLPDERSAPASHAERARARTRLRVHRKRRRPSGEPPPLPRELRRSGRFWLMGFVFILAVFILLVVLKPTDRVLERLDTWILQGLQAIRTPWLTRLARGLNALASVNVNLTLRWATILTLIFFRRWRHLAVFVGAILLVGWFGTALADFVARPRPFDVVIIGSWDGFSMPSAPVMSLSATLVGIAFTLIPDGRWRARYLWSADVVIALVCLSRLYLGLDHPTDVVFGVIFGMGTMVLAFRLFAPEEVFPVTYHRGRSAHLDVGGTRGEAIKRAVSEQLGLDVLEVKPFGLSASGGSTPLRMKVANEPGAAEDAVTYLFGKLYAANHLRADRHYKFVRTILYGRLEDEQPFSSVRQLVQYEDYMLRFFRDAGIPSPASYGFVEITPEREYLIIMEFFDGSKEISDVVVDDNVIDTALSLVRKLWDTGIAHRDIKPGNILVRDDEALLIDVAFAEIRPSPWRQAVDLANMMLVLGLYGDPKRVYERALRLFTPEELGEAFSASRGVASPSQLRGEIKRVGRDVLGEYRALAPSYPPVAIQRWSIRRIGVTAWTLFLIAVGVSLAVSNLRGAGLL
jgi:membrane-associated phospholipid phosphatase